MSNCHGEFLAFCRTITLNQHEIRKLEKSRDAIMRKITNHLKEKKYPAPEFRGQGSFTMGTSIRPLEGFYDLDLGVYLHGLGTDSDEWPRTETIQNLIFNAVEFHTMTKPIRKTACIRVVYRSPYIDKNDISYHIDLPIYAIEENFWGTKRTVIGLKGEAQWSESSDPQEFTDWFFERCHENRKDPEQLKRIVKYLKAWKEFMPASPKMPSGMILTVLAAKNYQPSDRDDIALFNTVTKFYNRLDWMFSITKPTTPENDLAESMSDVEQKKFMERANRFLSVAEKAIDSKSHRDAVKAWARLFGYRFERTESIKMFS